MQAIQQGFELDQLKPKLPGKSKKNVCIMGCKNVEQPQNREPAKQEQEESKKQEESESEKQEPKKRKRLIVDKRPTAPRFDRAALLAGLEDELPVWDVYHQLSSKVPTSILQQQSSPVGEKEKEEEIEVNDLEELEKLDLGRNEEEEEEEEEKEEKQKWDKERAKMKDVKLDLDDLDEIEEEEEEGKEKGKEKGKAKQKKKVVFLKSASYTNTNIGALAARLPPPSKMKMRISSHYMTNRKIYAEKLAQMFRPYREEILKKTENITCDNLAEMSKKSFNFDLLSHQRIVRDYLNLYTPYRGLLLYHSLGSGKTCTSIGIAEGMKSQKKIILMTPASLKANFFGELKKCGDALFKKNQFWEFISIAGKPENIDLLSTALGLPREYIESNGGAWLVNVKKASNYAQLIAQDQDAINAQLDTMIRAKYHDINYNGINRRLWSKMTEDGTVNPFDHSVVIIDEAHNFVSMVVNKLKSKDAIKYEMYHALMDAQDVRIVLISGTPIINYPNEIGVLFNILRGYIKTWTFQLQTQTTQKINEDFLLELFEKNGLRTVDYLQYSGNLLTITRNPFGFINAYDENKGKGKAKGKDTKKKAVVFKETKAKGGNNGNNETKTNRKTKKNKSMVLNDQSEQTQIGGEHEKIEYDGVVLDETGNISDEDFENAIMRILTRANIRAIRSNGGLNRLKLLPDDSKQFLELFIQGETGEMMNVDVFKRRILGLTSYYRSSQEQLLPMFVKPESLDRGDPNKGEPNYHLEIVEMSDYQFTYYYKIRKEERDKDKSTKVAGKKRALVKDAVEQISSTYRVFSRSACNFAFPAEQQRPLPDKAKDKITANDMDAVSKKQLKANAAVSGDEDKDEDDENDKAEGAEEPTIDYLQRIQQAMDFLRYDPLHPRPEEFVTEEALAEYSPKFLRILQNIKDPTNQGLHLLYSQFRTIEGLGILQLVFEANGYAKFSIVKQGEDWVLNEKPEDAGKPKFAFYTGTETAEEKEVVLNIYNGSWENVGARLSAQLRAISPNNHLGEIIKILMITASGAEGINLRNTRFVHITEPYWNLVRTEQVIGRARRICSHQDLPEEMRNVKVFLYLTTFTEKQKKEDKNSEIMLSDISRLDGKTPITTDENLYEIAVKKDQINYQILKSIKETSIDCSVYAGTETSIQENLVCYGYGKLDESNENEFSTFPALDTDRGQIQATGKERGQTVEWVARQILDPETGIRYALNEETGDIYDLKTYEMAKRGQTGEEAVKLTRVGKLMDDEIQFL